MAVYYIQHTKADCIKFVGHLDLQTTIHRNINRAELKIAFSQGFSPHMLMSSAQPLSVGVSSEAEYLMVELLKVYPRVPGATKNLRAQYQQSRKIKTI